MEAQGKDIATIWTTLFAMFPGFKDALDPDAINEPRNAMTIWGPLNQEFGKQSFALEPTVSTVTHNQYSD